jgi:hypothetical protein
MRTAMSLSKRAFLRSSAALLLPVLFLTSTAYGYSFAFCRHEQRVHSKACCKELQAVAESAETDIARLVRGCCDVHVVRLEQEPASEVRREACEAKCLPPATAARLLDPGLEPRLAFATPLPEVPHRSSGPPLYLLIRTLVV